MALLPRVVGAVVVAVLLFAIPGAESAQASTTYVPGAACAAAPAPGDLAEAIERLHALRQMFNCWERCEAGCGELGSPDVRARCIRLCLKECGAQ